MTDISDDGTLPNYARINSTEATLDEAIVAYNFLRALQCGSVFSTNIEALYSASRAERNAPGAAILPWNDAPEKSESSEDGETRSQVIRPYQSSRMSEVSDQNLWVMLHHGNHEDDSIEVDRHGSPYGQLTLTLGKVESFMPCLDESVR